MESKGSSEVDKSNKVKHDWYQTESHVILTIFIKNTKQENVNIDFEEREVNILVKLATNSEILSHYQLCHAIRPHESSFKLFSTRIEIKLKKEEGIKWEALEGDGNEKVKQFTTIESSSSPQPPAYPTSAPKKCDWSKIEAEVKREEEVEKIEGDAALNQLFQKIYADGSEEVKRAMNKSFMESGGTVLSTNWKEVGDKEVEVKAPDGMEWKKWDK